MNQIMYLEVKVIRTVVHIVLGDEYRLVMGTLLCLFYLVCLE